MRVTQYSKNIYPLRDYSPESKIQKKMIFTLAETAATIKPILTAGRKTQQILFSMLQNCGSLLTYIIIPTAAIAYYTPYTACDNMQKQKRCSGSWSD